MKHRIILLIMAVSFFGMVVPADAYLTFFGEDLNNSASVPLASFPNATNAQTNFLSSLVGVGQEDFESFSTGTSTPLSLTFPGNTITATLTGNGSVSTVTPGSTNGFGRYATSGANYWEVTAGAAGTFNVDLSEETAAFGFFGIDIGDFGGTLSLTLMNGTTTTLILPNTVGSSGSTDGSVVYFGLIAENAGEQFTSVSFTSTTIGFGETFAFDDFSIGSLAQVKSVPEPATFLLLGLGFIGVMGFGHYGRKSNEIA